MHPSRRLSLPVNTSSLFLATSTLSALLLGACTTQDEGPAVTDPDASGGEMSGEYIQERIRLKAEVGRDQIDQRLAELDKRFGITMNSPTEASAEQDSPQKEGLSKVAGVITSGNYVPRRSSRYWVWLVPGDSVEASTSTAGGGSSYVDPVLVLFTGLTGAGYINTDRTAASVLAFNDDAVGLHSRVLYKVPETENSQYAGVMVFPYSTTDAGVVVTTRVRVKRNGSWSTQVLENNPLRAVVYRPSSAIAPSYVRTVSPGTHSDTFLWIWNLSSVGTSSGVGGGYFNDDVSYSDRSSTSFTTYGIYPMAGGSLDVVVLGGKNNGTASSYWEHFN